MIAKHHRIIFGQALSINENDNIFAFTAMGASIPRMMLWHIFPNVFALLLVMMTILCAERCWLKLD